MNRERDLTQVIFDAVDKLDDDMAKESIEREPAFLYKGKRFRLDYVSKSDRLFLSKIFEEIEKDKDQNINFDLLKKQAEQEVLEVQKNMAKIQAKEFITVKEFTLLYSKSVKTQQAYRSRPTNPIPYIQKKLGDSVLYNKTEVENWLREKDLW